MSSKIVKVWVTTGVMLLAALHAHAASIASSYLIKCPKDAGNYNGAAELWSSPTVRRAAGEYRAGIPDGRWIFWDSGGTKIADFTFNRGVLSGPVKLWGSSKSGPSIAGKLKVAGSMVKNRWDGIVISYYPDGSKRSERTYRDGELKQVVAYSPSSEPLGASVAESQARDDDQADHQFLDLLSEVIRDAPTQSRELAAQK